MQYVVLIASKRDTSDRYWITKRSLEEAREAASNYTEDSIVFIHKLEGNY